MDGSKEKGPLIRQGWLRVLLFVAWYIFVSVFISIPAAFLVIFLQKKSGAETSGNDISTLLSGQYLWVMVVLAVIISVFSVYACRKWIDRKSFKSLGLSRDGAGWQAFAGFFLAPLILGCGTLILYFSGHLQWTDITFDPNGLFILFGMIFLQSFAEELVFRGYILHNLLDSFGKWVALVISALLFMLAHAFNPGINIIPLANLFLGGLLLGMNYIYTRNLWFAILFHFSWNFFQGPLLGYNVSGLNFQALIQTELKGDILLTGGSFGFEGSVFNLALSIIVVVMLATIYRAKFERTEEVAMR